MKPFSSYQWQQINTAATHLAAQCPWVMPYLTSLSTNGYGAEFAFGKFGQPGDMHDSPYSDRGGPDYEAKIHLTQTAFSSIRNLAITMAHEASHGFWQTPDNAGNYYYPGSGEDWGVKCYTP